MNWIIENKGWLFSGIAISVPLAIFGYFINRKREPTQKQDIGNNSTGYQVGGSININRKEK